MGNFGRLLKYLRPYRWRVLLSVALMLLVTFSTIPYPLILQYTLDVVIPHKRLDLLNWVFVAVVALYLVRGVLSFTLNYLITWLGQRSIFDLRFDVWRHLQRLSLSYYDQRQTGKIMSRITSDIDMIQNMITTGFVTLITDAVILVAVTALLFVKQWKLTFIVLAVVPLYVLNYKLFIRTAREISVKQRELWDEMLGKLQEKISGIAVVKAFTREEYEVDNFMSTVRASFQLGLRQARVGRTLSWISSVVTAAGGGLVLWYGGKLVMGRQLQVGELVAFNAYVIYLYGPAVRLVDFNASLQWTLAAIDRVFDMLDTQPEIEDAPNAMPLPPAEGRVQFDNVTFGYMAAQPVLHEINLTIDPGQKVAIVGRSGSGKTTLVSLLMRFYDPTEGTVRIDGHDLRDKKIDSIRRQVGMVSQENVLFSVTLRENIRYGKRDAEEDDVIAAAKTADLHEFIMELPDGYETKIGEDGIKLSVGQKQRLAIARAVLTDPRILILDDVTSALDAQTEANVQEALERVMQGRTSLVITHRLSSVMNADAIVVMDEGRIVAVGRHDELLARPGVYQDLHAEQFKSAVSALPPG